MSERRITSLFITSRLNWFHNLIDTPVCSMHMVALMLPSAVNVKNY